MSTSDRLPAPPPRPRRLLPAVAVVVVLVAVVFGGHVTAAVLSEPRGPAVRVGDSIRLHPLSGWEVAARFGDPPGIRLTRGSGNLDVAVIAFDGSDQALMLEYVAQVLDPAARQLSVSGTEGVVLADAARGVRITYVGTFEGISAPVEGEVTSVVTPTGVGVVFDGWSPSGLLRFVLEDVHAMIERAEIA